MEIEVQGHSGCQISISQENNTLFVLKGTNNISYIPRLIKQAEKQKNYSQEEGFKIQIPQIFSIVMRHQTVLLRWNTSMH